MFLTTQNNNDNDNEKNKHIFFLENLLLKLKNNQISQSEQREISEFYIKNMFTNNDPEIEEKNFYKYLYMGWYIYEFLIFNNNK
jgi:hypothetical protein